MSNFPIRFTPVTRKQIITLKTKKLTKDKYILLCIIFKVWNKTWHLLFPFQSWRRYKWFIQFIHSRTRAHERNFSSILLKKWKLRILPLLYVTYTKIMHRMQINAPVNTRARSVRSVLTFLQIEMPCMKPLGV